MKGGDWLSIVIFIFILIGWISISDVIGMGTVAIAGTALFLIVGLIKWEEINTGVNWGVVLLYAAAISLGLQMKETGAAQWVAQAFLEILSPLV